jgi:hypothetical protein
MLKPTKFGGFSVFVNDAPLQTPGFGRQIEDDPVSLVAQDGTIDADFEAALALSRVLVDGFHAKRRTNLACSCFEVAIPADTKDSVVERAFKLLEGVGWEAEPACRPTCGADEKSYWMRRPLRKWAH